MSNLLCMLESPRKSFCQPKRCLALVVVSILDWRSTCLQIYTHWGLWGPSQLDGKWHVVFVAYRARDGAIRFGGIAVYIRHPLQRTPALWLLSPLTHVTAYDIRNRRFVADSAGGWRILYQFRSTHVSVRPSCLSTMQSRQIGAKLADHCRAGQPSCV